MTVSPQSNHEHLSLYTLERLLAEERRDLDDARTHLDACAQCQQQYRELESEAASLASPDLVAAKVDELWEKYETASEDAPQRLAWLQRPQVWLPAAFAFALAAGVALLLLFWQLRDGAGTNRDLKRSVMTVIVARPGQAPRLLSPSESLSSDAMLGFDASCATECSVLLAGIGDTRAALIIENDVPGPWHLAPTLGATPATPLPVSVQVPDAHGHLRLVGLFCHPSNLLERDTFLKKLDVLYPVGPSGTRALRPEPNLTIPGCVTRTVLIPLQ